MSYTYDSLSRLASATSSDTPGWGQSFGYDGFGNLTNVNVTKGSAPSLSVSYNASTNRRTTDSADANGNILQSGVTNYDVENRITQANISGGTVKYSYAPGNKRLWRGTFDGSGNQGVDEITFYSASGAKLAAYDLTGSVYGPLYATCTGYYQYFGGKLIKNAGGYVNSDRLGSIGKFFPYGQERPSATANGKEKYATYFRDSETGLDYAQNRYHSSGDGRFLTPDPYKASAGPGDPGTWNRYAYAGDDPINHVDPAGLDYFTVAKLCGVNDFVALGGDGEGKITISAYCLEGRFSDPRILEPRRETNTEKPTDLNVQMDDLSEDCQKGLKTAQKDAGAWSRALQDSATLQTAASANGMDWRLLAAIGIRETGFQNIREKLDNGSPGPGHGIFQLTVKPGSGVTAAQAGDLSWAANYAAKMLADNMAYLAKKFPNFTPTQLLQATAASYNLGRGGISGNPDTIDVGSAPGGLNGNYGSNVLDLMRCF